jgi:signal transduction histidine kinase
MHIQELNRYRSLEGQFKYTEFVRLELHDFGVGMGNEGADRAFELFHRLHADGGTGLGLALCRKIIEMHEGEISIRGKEEEGTTVCILMPVSIQEAGSNKSVSS